jgi:transposase
VSISELCRREGIVSNLFFRRSVDLLEAVKKQLQGDTTREATSSEVGDLRSENEQLEQFVAELGLHNHLLKKE